LIGQSSLKQLSSAATVPPKGKDVPLFGTVNKDAAPMLLLEKQVWISFFVTLKKYKSLCPILLLKQV
jgi:hypothetical protein